jgi:chemotaxis signal transduction protein
VQEINRMVTVTHVPQAAQFMEGVINLRGRLIPIIDLRTRFGMERAERTKNTRIVVTEIGTKRLGMVVDSVSEVLRIPAFAFARAPLRTARTDVLVDLRRIAGLCSAGHGRRASSPDRVHESRSGPRGRRFGVSRP